MARMHRHSAPPKWSTTTTTTTTKTLAPTRTQATRCGGCALPPVFPSARSGATSIMRAEPTLVHTTRLLLPALPRACQPALAPSGTQWRCDRRRRTAQPLHPAMGASEVLRMCRRLSPHLPWSLARRSFASSSATMPTGAALRCSTGTRSCCIAAHRVSRVAQQGRHPPTQHCVRARACARSMGAGRRTFGLLP